MFSCGAMEEYNGSFWDNRDAQMSLGFLVLDSTSNLERDVCDKIGADGKN